MYQPHFTEKKLTVFIGCSWNSLPGGEEKNRTLYLEKRLLT